MELARLRVILAGAAPAEVAAAIAAEAGWELQREVPRADTRPAELIYETPVGTLVDWIDDPTIGVAYVLVSGRGAPAIVDLVRARLPWLSGALLVQAAADSGQPVAARERALHRLAIAHTEQRFDAEVGAVFTMALRDPTVEIRDTAVRGALLLSWPELAPALRPLAGPGEPDAIIRQNAALACSRLQAREPHRLTRAGLAARLDQLLRAHARAEPGYPQEAAALVADAAALAAAEGTAVDHHLVAWATVLGAVHGRGALWELLAVELLAVRHDRGLGDVELARDLLAWLRERAAPDWLATPTPALGELLAILRRRIVATDLLAHFPIALDLVARGLLALPRALDDLARFDRHPTAV